MRNGSAKAPPQHPSFAGFVPTRRLVLLAFFGSLPLAMAFAVPSLRALVVVCDLLLVALTLLDRRLAKRTRVELARHPKDRLNVGIANPIVVRLKNLSDRHLKLRVRDDVPEGIESLGETFERSLEPFEVSAVTYAAMPQRRGRFELGDLHVRALGPLGLCAVEARVPAAEEVRVYPDLRGAKRLLLATAYRDLAHLGVRRLRRDGSGSELARLRDYVQGDSIRDVDWKATARRKRPVTRVHETEKSQNVVLCLDAGRSMAARVDGLTKLDYAVEAALFLAFVAIRNGDRVGLAVFDDGVRAFLPPQAGRAQYRRIVEALYAARAGATFVDYQALFRELATRVRKRSLVVVFTDLLDEEQARSMVAPLHRLARRHVSLCVTLRDQGLEDLLRTRPAEVDDAYRQAVAQEVLDDREALRTLIARDGVRLVDAAPCELSLAAVNRYLEVKQHGLL